jgi:putative membrane protein
MVIIPYCGAAPLPGTLWGRFNLDPAVIGALLLVATWQWRALPSRMSRARAAGGWLLASGALLSPLCALSVALFSARVAQHMILILGAAPLIAMGLPARRTPESSGPLWVSVSFFFVALWLWHMPVPYAATFSSVIAYWCMHLTLFGSAIYLWRELLHHPPERTLAALAAGTLTFVQMGLLGAMLAFADRAIFPWHFGRTQVWGLTALEDQQLGGVFMWIPGVALFLWSGVRSVSRLWQSIDPARLA